MKHTPLLIILGTLVMVLGLGCKSEQQSTGPGGDKPGTPIKIAAAYWPGTYWIDVANAKGMFKEAGLNVTVVDVNADFFGSFEKLVNGELDVIGMPFFDFVRLNAEGKELTGFLITDYVHGAEGIVARPGIERIQDLKGKRVGLTRNTYSEYIFTVVAERDALKLSDVTIVDIEGETADSQLIEGKVDAVFIWEPLLSRAVEGLPGSKVLFTTAEIPGISGGIECVRREFAIERPDDIRKLLKVWQRASNYISQYPEESYAIVSKANNVPVDDVRKFTTLDKVIGVRENDVAFSFAAGFDSIHGTARRINDFLIEKGMTSKKLVTSTLVDPSFVRELSHSTHHTANSDTR